MEKRQRFGASSAPSWYVPGLCRGATGFVTRSDLGPLRVPIIENPFRAAPEGYRAGIGRGAGVLPAAVAQRGGTDKGDFTDLGYDKWSGYQGSLGSQAEYDHEDDEADEIYDGFSNYMDGRRKNKREKNIMKSVEQSRKKQKPIQQILSSCKKDLSGMSREDWEAIPEAPPIRSKRKKYNRCMPLPDSVIHSALNDVQYSSSVVGGDVSGVASRVPSTPMTEVSLARNQILSVRLAEAEERVTGQTTVNPNAYLEKMGISKPETANMDISDIKKARLLMKSVISTKPNDPSGWVAAARIEELDGKLKEARNILAQGCYHCPDSDDIWLEAARLSPPDKSKAVLAKAISQQPNSVKLWLAAANKETDLLTKSKILRRGLEFIPSSEALWKEAIKLEKEEEAKQVLYKAVECVPYSVDMWLALAKLETYENAQTVLNRALKYNKTNHVIWIHAAKLEEAQGAGNEAIELKIRRCVKKLTELQINIAREKWLQEAIEAEESGSVLTCRAIIKATMEIGLEKDEYKEIWIQNASFAIEKGAVETARKIYEEAVTRLPNKKQIWLNYFEFEKKIGDNEKLLKAMSQALSSNPMKLLYYLLYAKQLWILKDFEKCREILNQAREQLGTTEEIMAALVKFERQNKNKERAIELIREACKKIKSLKLFKQCLIMEKGIENNSNYEEMEKEATTLFSSSPGLWSLIITLEFKNIPKAKEKLSLAQSKCEDCPKLRIISARLDAVERCYTTARTILQDARIKFKGSESLWIDSIRLEIEAKNIKIAEFLLSKGLQECPKSGKLWKLAIELEPIHLRKAKGMDATKVCPQDEHVALAIARIFWSEFKLEKARKWFSRAIAYNPINGDTWANYYKFEKFQKSEENASVVVDKCVAAQPRKGEIWKSLANKPENWFYSYNELLVAVAEEISIPEQ